MNKRTLVESELAIDSPMTLPDGTIAELTIGEIEADRIINFNETDHFLKTEFDKGGNRSIRWGDNSLPKGAQSVCKRHTHTQPVCTVQPPMEHLCHQCIYLIQR